jgi:hypothetical protein
VLPHTFRSLFGLNQFAKGHCHIRLPVHTGFGVVTSARTILWNAARMGIGAEILRGTDMLLNSGPFLLPSLSGRSSPIRRFSAWLPLPLLWKFVAFPRGIPFSSALENPQGFGAIATATPFPKILLGTQSRNLFRHCHIDELV